VTTGKPLSSMSRPAAKPSSVAPARRPLRDNPPLILAGIVLQHVLGPVAAVGKLREPNPGAALRVVEDLRHPGAKHVSAIPRGELEQATLAGQVGGALRAEIRESLARVAHLGGQSRQVFVAYPGRRDHDARLLEPGGANRHAGRCRASHVGVVGSAGGEAQQRLPVEDRRDQRDVRQVRPAPVRVVEHPERAGLLL